jgi:hypothetical protein
MQQALKWLLPFGICFVNGFLAFCFYVASTIFDYSHLLKTNLTFLSRVAFVVGLVAVLAAVTFSNKMVDLTKIVLLTVLTLFNQACVIAFLVSVLPFGGQVLRR